MIEKLPEWLVCALSRPRLSKYAVAVQGDPRACGPRIWSIGLRRIPRLDSAWPLALPRCSGAMGRREGTGCSAGVVPLVQPVDVQGHRIRHSGEVVLTESAARMHSRYAQRAGDVLMTRTGTVGRFLCALPVLLPPLADQRMIGDALDALDEQRRTCTELIAARDECRGELADLLMTGYLPPLVRR